MNYQKYLEIKEKYGKHASWAVWSDEKDTPTSNMEDVSFFDDKEIYKQLNPNIILVGLNISTTFDETPFLNFHGKGGGAYKIRYATKDTPYWGAYLTDIIKDFPEKHSGNVMKYLRQHNDIVTRNISSFEQELEDIGAVDPMIYAFANDAYEILKHNLGKQYQIKKLIHYSHFMSREKYREHALKNID